MSGGDDAAIAENKYRIDLVDDLRIGNRVDLVHPDYFAVATQTHGRAAANDIQVTDTHVVADRKLLYACDYVQMADLHVVFDGALMRVDDAKPDANSFADLISKEQSIKWTFKKGWQDRENGQYQQTRSACLIHLGG